MTKGLRARRPAWTSESHAGTRPPGAPANRLQALGAGSRATVLELRAPSHPIGELAGQPESLRPAANQPARTLGSGRLSRRATPGGGGARARRSTRADGVARASADAPRERKPAAASTQNLRPQPGDCGWRVRSNCSARPMRRPQMVGPICVRGRRTGRLARTA